MFTFEGYLKDCQLHLLSNRSSFSTWKLHPTVKSKLDNVLEASEYLQMSQNGVIMKDIPAYVLLVPIWCVLATHALMVERDRGKGLDFPAAASGLETTGRSMTTALDFIVTSQDMLGCFPLAGQSFGWSVEIL